MSNHQETRASLTDRVAKAIRWLSVPIVLFWLVVAGLTNALVPQLEVVGEAHNVGLSSPDSPSLQAFKKIGEVFKEFDSDSAAMIVLEGDQPLGADAHKYYDTLIQRIGRTTSTFSTSRTSGETRSRRLVPKALMAKRPTSKSFSSAIKAKRSPSSLSTRSATS